jgi:hypothetical protein
MTEDDEGKSSDERGNEDEDDEDDDRITRKRSRRTNDLFSYARAEGPRVVLGRQISLSGAQTRRTPPQCTLRSPSIPATETPNLSAHTYEPERASHVAQPVTSVAEVSSGTPVVVGSLTKLPIFARKTYILYS